MPGLTTKVFRTYNASYTISQLLNKIELSTKAPIAKKITRYNTATYKVAILYNYRRTVGIGYANAITKIEDKIKVLVYSYTAIEGTTRYIYYYIFFDEDEIF